MIAIFGTNLASAQMSASAPLPLTLGGTSVTINGVPSPLSFVSPGQINAAVPSSLTAPDHTIIAVAVAVTTSGGSASMQTGLASASPGFFTADGSGCGQAAALNIRPDGSVSVNSPANSAAPGDYIALFGTGLGVPAQPVEDGAAGTGPLPLRVAPGLTVDGAAIPSLAYSGLAPGLAGVDQINFQVPATIRSGCAVPVRGSQQLASPNVTISVQDGGRQCTDPPVQSYGQIVLSSTAGAPESDSYFASFPSGPDITPTPPEQVVYAPVYVANVPSAFIEFSAFPFTQRSCAVSGYTNLSAGSIRITPPSGNPVTLGPQPDGVGGVLYAGGLPAGFVVPGVYTISGTTAASVNLNTQMTVGAPIQIQSAFPPGALISSSQPLTLRWTGGDPDAVVRFALTSQLQTGVSTSSYTYAHVRDGSLTIPPVCTSGNPLNPKFCTFGLPPSSNASITVQEMPDPAKTPTVTVSGITGPVSLSWHYAWGFPNLVLGQ